MVLVRSVQRSGVEPTNFDIDRTAPNRVEVCGPPAPDWVSGLARAWFESLRTCGQSVFYVDSDWAVALVVCKAIQAFEAKPTAFMLARIMKSMRSLAATEGDRRSLRIELARGSSR